MKFFRFFFLIIGIFVVSQAFSQEKQEINQSEKIYVQPDQISLLPDGISVCLNSQWFPVNAIYSDSQGVYVTNLSFFTWICPKCGWENSWLDNQCQNCPY
ncbi:MAG: hypothetical protein Q8L98_02655 [Chlamydiales bacterium]|nr:hypothetical protein [Chlamydiales bacterium]